VETAIWLTEVAPNDTAGKTYLDHLARANGEANPGLLRLALEAGDRGGQDHGDGHADRLAVDQRGAPSGSRRFSKGFLVVAPGLTIKERLRVLQPNDPDSYYASRQLVPDDLVGELSKAKIVITNYHAFMRRSGSTCRKPGARCSRVGARS